MIGYALTALSLAASVSSGASDAPAGVEVADLSIWQSIIVHVPGRRARHPAAPEQAPAAPAFSEHKGPKCIDAATIGGAAVSAPDSVDLILRGGKRVRAKLEEECPALDYYSGFYFQAPGDGKLCADRDSIHTRSGGDCEIDKFRALTPSAPAK